MTLSKERFAYLQTCPGASKRLLTQALEAEEAEEAVEDESGQLTLGVPGEQRAIPTLGKRLPLNVEVACRTPKDHPDRFERL